jgi:hypothetical protein
VLLVKGLAQSGGLGVDPAVAPGLAQQRADLGESQPARCGRSGDGGQARYSAAICVVQVVHIPYVVEQDEDGAWRASALLRPGVGAVGDGVSTREEAVTHLRAALMKLLEVVGPPSELTVTVNSVRLPAASRLEPS